ncbi:F-box/LRR-repeat protein 25 [Linum grandiflorum]
MAPTMALLPESINFERFADATSKRLLHERSVPLLLDSFNITLQNANEFPRLYRLLSSAWHGNRSPLKVVVKTWNPRDDLIEGGMLLNCLRTKILHLQCFNLGRSYCYKACLENLRELNLEYVRQASDVEESCAEPASTKVTAKAIMSLRKKRKKKEQSPTAADQISQLQEEIIYLILQRLPSHKEAARTSVLSKKWLQLWRSYPFVDYDSCKLINFESFAVATSKRLLHERSVPLPLDSFNIIMHSRYEPQCLYQLLSSALGDSTRSPLKVMVRAGYHNGSLQGGAILLNCLRTKFLNLEDLDLSGFRSYNKACRYNLQNLALCRVQVSEESFLSCLANAPLLKNLTLILINGIHSLDISASNFPSLKSLSFHGYILDRSAELQKLQLSSAPLLAVFSFQGDCNLLTVVSAPIVKFLTLHPRGELFGRGEFDGLSSKFPSLKSLEIDIKHIRRSDGLRVSSHSLRNLIFLQGTLQENVLEIDTPNLTSLFIHTARIPININIVNVSSNCRCYVYCLSLGRIPTSWLNELRECLTILTTRIRHLVFQLYFGKHSTEVGELDFSQVGCESSPLVVQHLRLGTNLPLRADLPRGPINKTKLLVGQAHLVDGILCAFHPKTLSIARLPRSRHNTSLFSYISRGIEMENLQNCCNSGKCWRHQFKDAKITSLTVDAFHKLYNLTSSQQSVYMILSFR